MTCTCRPKHFTKAIPKATNVAVAVIFFSFFHLRFFLFLSSVLVTFIKHQCLFNFFCEIIVKKIIFITKINKIPFCQQYVYYFISEWQNYLRTQAGNTTTVNVVICTVDYLLRLQESIMDFYWHYSSKELIDPAGKANFFKAIGVASQVFNTLTEVIQGPCTLNQQALAHSR